VADWLHIVGIAALAAGVGVTMWLFLVMDVTDNPSIAEMLAFFFVRAPALAILGAIAAYAIRESSQHRARDKENKRLANELTTFRPFLEELKEDERTNQIVRASDRYFPGHEKNDHTSEQRQ
jgi:hypothetical protein